MVDIILITRNINLLSGYGCSIPNILLVEIRNTDTQILPIVSL